MAESVAQPHGKLCQQRHKLPIFLRKNCRVCYNFCEITASRGRKATVFCFSLLHEQGRALFFYDMALSKTDKMFHVKQKSRENKNREEKSRKANRKRKREEQRKKKRFDRKNRAALYIAYIRKFGLSRPFC